MNRTGHAILILAFLVSSPAVATEIYHWVDENGVSNFSSTAPAGEDAEVNRMVLEDSPAPRYDPEADPFNVEAQAERMAQLREDMAKRREAERDRRANAAQRQPAVQYRDRYIGGRSWYGGYPVYPRPPVRPQPPIAVPYETATFRPPGLSPN